MRNIHPLSFLFLLIVIPYFNLCAQTGTVPTGSDTSCTNRVSLFQKLYGGNKDDFAAAGMAATADSGYVMAGWTNSFGNGGMMVC